MRPLYPANFLQCLRMRAVWPEVALIALAGPTPEYRSAAWNFLSLANFLQEPPATPADPQQFELLVTKVLEELASGGEGAPTAARLLGFWHRPEATPALIHALDSPDRELRHAAAIGLLMLPLDPANPASDRAISVAGEALGDEDAKWRILILRHFDLPYGTPSPRYWLDEVDEFPADKEEWRRGTGEAIIRAAIARKAATEKPPGAETPAP